MQNYLSLFHRKAKAEAGIEGSNKMTLPAKPKISPVEKPNIPNPETGEATTGTGSFLCYNLKFKLCSILL